MCKTGAADRPTQTHVCKRKDRARRIGTVSYSALAPGQNCINLQAKKGSSNERCGWRRKDVCGVQSCAIDCTATGASRLARGRRFEDASITPFVWSADLYRTLVLPARGGI